MALLRAKLLGERASMPLTRGGPATTSAVVVVEGDPPPPPGTFADAASAATVVLPATVPVDGVGDASGSEEELSAYSSSEENSEEADEVDFGAPDDSEL
jgi:hypothetical protein